MDERTELENRKVLQKGAQFFALPMAKCRFVIVGNESFEAYWGPSGEVDSLAGIG